MIVTVVSGLFTFLNGPSVRFISFSHVWQWRAFVHWILFIERIFVDTWCYFCLYYSYLLFQEDFIYFQGKLPLLFLHTCEFVSNPHGWNRNGLPAGLNWSILDFACCFHRLIIWFLVYFIVHRERSRCWSSAWHKNNMNDFSDLCKFTAAF